MINESLFDYLTSVFCQITVLNEKFDMVSGYNNVFVIVPPM